MFVTWEELGPLLAYALEDDELQAVVGMRNLLRALYADTPSLADLRAAEVVRAYILHCCKAVCQSNYLFYLEEDVRLAVADAVRVAVGLGAANGKDVLCFELKKAARVAGNMLTTP